MKNNTFKNTLLLLLAAFFWGTTFVSQSVAAETLPTFTYTCARSLLACVFLAIVIKIFDRVGVVTKKPATKEEKKVLLKGGLVCGGVLFVGMALQQYGMAFTTAGKAGFITALYIIIVPIVGIFFKKKTTLFLKLGIVLAVFGMYFLCIDSGFSIGRGDFFILLCSGGFAAHILVVDYFSPKVDGMRLSLLQFIVVGGICLIIALITERPTASDIMACWFPILYAAVFSSGVAYTLQILAQKDLNPTIAAIVMSCESVFSVLAGWIVLGEKLSGREFLGCAFMLVAIILSQMPQKQSYKEKGDVKGSEC